MAARTAMKKVAPAGLPPYWPRTGKKSIGSDGGGAASLDATLALYLMLFGEVFSRVEKVGVVMHESLMTCVLKAEPNLRVVKRLITMISVSVYGSAD